MTFTRQKTCILLGLAAVIVLVIAGFEEFKDYRAEREIRIKARVLVTLAEPSPKDTFHGQADAIMDFVWRNSTHKVDEEFYRDFGFPARQMDGLAAFASGRTRAKPHLECSTRSGIVRRMMAVHGYVTRSIDVYRLLEGFHSHSFLEVKNPATGHWEVMDPDNNLYWTNKDTGERASMVDLLALPFNAFDPCRPDEGCPSETAFNDRDLMLKLWDYYRMAVIFDPKGGGRDLYYNPARLTLNRTAMTNDGPKTICQYAEKICRRNIITVKSQTSTPGQ